MTEAVLVLLCELPCNPLHPRLKTAAEISEPVQTGPMISRPSVMEVSSQPPPSRLPLGHYNEKSAFHNESFKKPFAIGRHISLIKTSAREAQICSAVNAFVWDPGESSGDYSITGFLNNFLSYVK